MTTQPKITLIVTRWVARLMGLGLACVLVASAIFDGFDQMPQSKKEWADVVFFGVGLFSLLVAWKWELLGGIAVVLIVVAWSIVDLVALNSFPGWEILMFLLLPGVLFVTCSIIGPQGISEDAE